MSMEFSLEVMGPKEDRESFANLAIQAGIEAKNCFPNFAPGQIVNCPEFLRIVFSREAADIFIALCGVITAWLAFRSSRKIILSLSSDKQVVSIDARAYSKDELLEIIPHCQRIIVYEKKED